MFKFHLFLLAIILNSAVGIAQSGICGLYIYEIDESTQLDLHPNKTYYYTSAGWEGVIYRDTGTFVVEADTIILFSAKHERKQNKFLIINDSTPDDFLCIWRKGSIAQIQTRDSAFSKNTGGRISDFEALFYGSFIKYSGYYDNGKLAFKTDRLGRLKVKTYYYESGQVKCIEKYSKEKKDGDWYYFSEDGTIMKVERFRKGKLINSAMNG